MRVGSTPEQRRELARLLVRAHAVLMDADAITGRVFTVNSPGFRAIGAARAKIEKAHREVVAIQSDAPRIWTPPQPVLRLVRDNDE